MGSSRNSSSGELPERAAAVLAPAISPGAHLALGLSGGVDSVALLAALTELAPAMRFSLRAVHINHGISSNAARWAEFCAQLCAGFRVPLQLEMVDIGPYRNLGLEGAARRARYDAFARVDADFIVLAQHRDDQAETLLLRLLRGAGLRGLSAMSPLRGLPGTRARLLRPLLAMSRAEIETYARLRGLEWIEDESNVDTLRRRNFLWHETISSAAAAAPPSIFRSCIGWAKLARKMFCAIGAKLGVSSRFRRRGRPSCCANSRSLGPMPGSATRVRVGHFSATGKSCTCGAPQKRSSETCAKPGTAETPCPWFRSVEC